jgi:hypothetical protein
MLKVCMKGSIGGTGAPAIPGTSGILIHKPGNRPERSYLSWRTVVFLTMRDKGTSRGKSKSTESADTKPAAEGKASQPAPMTAKEKIAANQKNKRRK